jgi:hypothetical protein
VPVAAHLAEDQTAVAADRTAVDQLYAVRKAQALAAQTQAVRG